MSSTSSLKNVSVIKNDVVYLDPHHRRSRCMGIRVSSLNLYLYLKQISK